MEWTRSTRVPFHDIEDRSACLNTCIGASRVLNGHIYQMKKINTVGTQIIRTGAIPPSSLPVSDPF